MATLELSGIRKSFGPVGVLHGVDLSVADGEMIVIVGASGCGKSTLLRIVAGLETPSTGRVRIAGRDVTALEPADRDIAMVFQNYALYPHMSVAQNMGYGLKIRGLPRAEIDRRVREAAELLALGPLLDRRPRQLSGGQRQRVAMGRAIVREPKLFLFDEPLSNLDAKLRVQMRAEIRRLQRRLGVTSLFVTHDQVEAMTLGDRLVVMHQGHAAQVATPMEIFERPADTYVAGFIGSPAMNFLAGTLVEGGHAVALQAGPVLRFADGPRPGPEEMPLTIGIRPEHLRPDPGGLPLALDLVEPLGSETVLHGRLPDGEALVVKLSGPGPREGVLPVSLPPAALHVFAAEGGKRLDPVA
ncbi:sn-glycerol-3-phosphate ABC transporter ATP-binding protein UgpC [Roseicella aquatilis]|uniref:sn-glycerol-3-phosphate ABC transporter ATP-binding protein UgpC n=1 Tax=Roseicella aquatilis TaxID=2527868 RepID=A0A4R4DE15_9PROT|nr:sn-glycerol-3-phosphate ABC transporter ATP-binding protein UgpC [Roseicella aquatilis]TCZ58565.1 sn-glycerol-3-phosphate ABC transporter ATP-binding protein UgpC [Roseicella aquatilis]